MIDSASILHDLDLLDDWLSGRGYGEEAGLVLRAMTLINAQAGEIECLRDGLDDAKNVIAVQETQIEKLWAALKPFSDLLATAEKIRPSHDRHLLWVEKIDLRAAAAALKETGDE